MKISCRKACREVFNTQAKIKFGEQKLAVTIVLFEITTAECA